MEQEDSYSSSSKLLLHSLARTLGYQSSCLQKRSLQELYNQALIVECLKYLSGYQKNSTSQRPKPLVPKFEETHKKIKIESNMPEYSNDLSRVNARPQINPTNRVTDTNAYKGLATTSFVNFQQIEDSNKDDSPTISVKVEEINDIKLKEINEAPLDANVPLRISTTSNGKGLDRKDMKKLQKFEDLYHEYAGKLKIADPQIFEKFKQISILVIPKLLSHFKSKPFEAVAAAVLLYACREVDHPITLKQIVSIADTKEKLINKCIFSLKEILPSNTEVKHFKAGEFINFLAKKLKLEDHVRIAATKIWQNIEKLNLMKSTHAITLATCCLKFACSLSNADQDFDTLASAAETTKMTLKNMYRDLFPYRFHFITQDCMLSDPNELKKI